MGSRETSVSTRFEINLLGNFSVYIDSQAIKGRKARSLLKLIAHQRHYQMVREQAMEELWPELDVEAASSQLYKALHHIRKAFSGHAKDAENWIEISDDLIRLVPPDGVITDLQLFEKTAREGIQTRQLPALETAVSIYKGDFLPMERYAEWANAPREHYRQLYLDVLTTLATRYEQEGSLHEAAEMLRLALEKEPTLETAHRQLMQIFARKGQITRAYHQYDLCRDILNEELGMGPSTETRETLDDIREGRLSQEDEHTTLRPSVPGPVSPIFGRHKECTTISRSLNDLLTKQGGLLLISGEMGTGKTRLVQELIHQSRRQEIPFFIGRTGENIGSIAYEPFIELFNEILHKHPELQAELPVEIGKLIPGYAGNGAPVPHADKLAAKSYLFAQTLRFFSRLTTNHPTVVILEDLHIADPESQEMFAYLIRHSANMPLLFVATIRKEINEPASKILSKLQDHAREFIELHPLSFDEHANLLHHHGATAGFNIESTEHIFHLSEGNPLFAVELLQLYAEEEQPGSPQTGKDKHTGQAPDFPVKLPPSLQYMVEHMTKDLSPSARQLLHMAAVIGRKVPYELLAAVWRGGKFPDEEVLFDSLEEVIRARLLVESSLDYSFRHTLIREAIYTSISEARRRSMHKLVAGQMIEMSGYTNDEPVEQIAFHLLHAGETLQGAQYLLRAGERAESAYAHEDALQQYRQAREVLEKQNNETANEFKYKALEHMGDVYRACGQLEKSFDVYQEAIAFADMVPLNERDLVELHRKMAVAAILRTDMGRSEQHLNKAFELAGEDMKTHARLFITKALHLWHLNQLEEAYTLAQRALESSEQIEASAEASQACEILAMTCLPLGRWEEGLKYEMQRKIYGWSPEIVVATDAHLCLWEYHVSGDQPFQQARSFLEQVAGNAEKTGDMRCVAV